jgi:hypothetical protein
MLNDALRNTLPVSERRAHTLRKPQIIWKTTRTARANCLLRSNTPDRFWNQRYYAVTLVVTPT